MGSQRVSHNLATNHRHHYFSLALFHNPETEREKTNSKGDPGLKVKDTQSPKMQEQRDRLSFRSNSNFSYSN